MASVMKCDRCGEIYEKNIKPFFYDDDDSVVEKIVLKNSWGRKIKYDLCDKCVGELSEFLTNKNKEIKADKRTRKDNFGAGKLQRHCNKNMKNNY